MFKILRTSFMNYKPITGTIRVAICLLAGVPQLIFQFNLFYILQLILAVAMLIYGIKLFFIVPFSGIYEPNYHRGYWSDGSAEDSIFAIGAMLGIKATIAVAFGIAVFGVEVVQTVRFWKYKIANKERN